MNAKLIPAPGVHAPYMKALESQLEAFRLTERLLRANHPSIKELDSQWSVDQTMLKAATPFAWTDEPIAAVRAAGNSIPLDTLLNSWNLNTSAAWWWFEDPLPYTTITCIRGEYSEIAKQVPIRALNFGWMEVQSESRKIPAGMPTWMLEEVLRGKGRKGLFISAWLDDPAKEFPIVPSQTMLWDYGVNLEQALITNRSEHQGIYGPGGKWADKPQIGVEEYMRTTEGILRFIMAGLVWLSQKIIITNDAHIERHRRKDFNRKTGQELNTVKVVNLRRTERPVSSGEVNLEDKREYACRWQVDGHWRNQACGTGMQDHRLQWISPYLKGPEDKPLRIPQQKVYRVSR